jgi:phospholipid/cholesterol/gamma-HCH transport system ATP-binding protein
MKRSSRLFDSLTAPRLGFFRSQESLRTTDNPQATTLNSDRRLVEMIGVNFHFGEKTIFDNFDLKVAVSERLVLLGPSGIGKSTLLRLLLGTLKPESGRIFLNGVEIDQLGREKLNRIRTHIGMVFQSSALISSLTVFENLALPLRELTEKSEAEIRAIAEEKLHFVNLDYAKFSMPAELSGGMKKRVAIARSLVLSPDLILFDEPTTGLDPIVARQVSDLILHFNQKAGTTILVVTHDLQAAFHIATRIALLSQGRIVESGPPAAIKASHNTIVTEFLAAASEEPPPIPQMEAGAKPYSPNHTRRLSDRSSFLSRRDDMIVAWHEVHGNPSRSDPSRRGRCEKHP